LLTGSAKRAATCWLMIDPGLLQHWRGRREDFLPIRERLVSW